MAGRLGRSGGARPGAGRKRTTLHLTMPPLVLAQYEEVARVEGATLAEVVREALLSWLAEWQARHDYSSPGDP